MNAPFRRHRRRCVVALWVWAGAAMIPAGPVSAQTVRPAAGHALDLGLAGDAGSWAASAAAQAAELRGQWTALPGQPSDATGIRPMVKLRIDPHGDSRDDQQAIVGVQIPISPVAPN